jgi:hypothetical protein
MYVECDPSNPPAPARPFLPPPPPPLSPQPCGHLIWTTFGMTVVREVNSRSWSTTRLREITTTGIGPPGGTRIFLAGTTHLYSVGFLSGTTRLYEIS